MPEVDVEDQQHAPNATLQCCEVHFFQPLISFTVAQ